MTGRKKKQIFGKYGIITAWSLTEMLAYWRKGEKTVPEVW